MSNVFDGLFLVKIVKGWKSLAFLQKNSSIYVLEGSNYASLAVSF